MSSNPANGRKASRTTGKHRPRDRRTLRFESLEGRKLLSTTPLHSGLPDDAIVVAGAASDTRVTPAANVDVPPAPWFNAGRCLVISGSPQGNDDVTVTGDSRNLRIVHKVNGQVIRDVWFHDVQRLFFKSGDGDNTFRNETSVPSEAQGGYGRDHFLGGAGADLFNGGGGNDVLEGRDGNDTLDGASGNDRLEGGRGNDSLRAGTGAHNILKGGSGDDQLFGGTGYDELYGQDGNDFLEDGFGSGYLNGGAGDDALRGATPGTSGMEMHGGPGNDQLWRRDHLSRDWKLLRGVDDFVFPEPQQGMSATAQRPLPKAVSGGGLDRDLADILRADPRQ